jgi:hypothetical protein
MRHRALSACISTAPTIPVIDVGADKQATAAKVFEACSTCEASLAVAE